MLSIYSQSKKKSVFILVQCNDFMVKIGYTLMFVVIFLIILRLEYSHGKKDTYPYVIEDTLTEQNLY